MANTDPDHWFLPARHIPRSPAYTSENSALALVDGQAYFDHVASRVAKMVDGNEIYIAGWRVSPDQHLQPLVGPSPVKFVDVVTSLGIAGVRIRSMLWYVVGSSIALVNSQLTAHPKGNVDFTKAVIKAGGHGILDERLLHKRSSHHQKFIIVQSPGSWWAYVGGIDIALDRWDMPSHKSHPARQREFLDAWHDVQCGIRGPAVTQVWENFRERWDDPRPPARSPSPVPTASPPRIGAPPPVGSLPPPPASAGRQHIQVHRTLVCKNVYSFAPRGEQTCQLAYERAIVRAEHFIYIEEQYLWPCRVVDRLALAVRSNAKLKVVIVLARDYDLPAPMDAIHYDMRRECLQKIKGWSKGQVFAFHLEQNPGSQQVYVHSKLMIVDDCYATIGSMNINKRSATTDSELGVAVVDEDTLTGAMDGEKVTVCRFAHELRVKLWAEHLRVPNHLLRDPIAALQYWPDCTRSSWRSPSKVHHAVCHHSPPRTTTPTDWISLLEAILSELNLPSETEMTVREALAKFRSLPASDFVFGDIRIKIGALLWEQLRKLIRDLLMNVETVC